MQRQQLAKIIDQLNTKYCLMNHTRSRKLIRPFYSQLLGLSRALDNLLIFLALFTSLQIYEIPLSPEYLLICLISIILFSLFAENHELYQGWRGAPMFDEAVRILVSWLTTCLLIVSGLFISHSSFDFSKIVLELWLPLTPLTIILVHTTRRNIMSFLRMHGLNTRYYAILGANTLGQRLKIALSEMPWLGYSFVGFYDDRVKTQEGRVSEAAASISGNFNGLGEE